MSETNGKKSINPAIASMMRRTRDFLAHEHSLFATMNIEPLLIDRNRTRFSIDLPAEFAGPDGRMHSAFLTIILDSLLGITVFTALDELTPIATINLRTDYLAAADCGARAVCDAECIDVANEIARVQGTLHLESGGALLAAASGAFMVGTRGTTTASRL